MSKKNIGLIVGLVLAAGAVIFLIYKLVAGLLGLVAGAIDVVIGLVVNLALAALVIWMFAYARRH